MMNEIDVDKIVYQRVKRPFCSQAIDVQELSYKHVFKHIHSLLNSLKFKSRDAA